MSLEDKAEMITLMRDCKYWFVICKEKKFRRPPLITASLLTAMFTVYYVADEGNKPGDSARALIYIPGPDHEWYRSLSAMFSHVNDNHLVMNAIMLFLLGSLFEFTEGIVKTACCTWGGGTLGFALHGAMKPNTMVRGMSGAIYGIMFAQISLLALNWVEMGARWARALIIAILLGVDIVTYLNWKTPGVSYEAHCFGALAGICVALVLGRNLRLRKWEITMTWGGVLGYVALVVAAFAGNQLSAALLASALIPILVGYAIYLTAKAWHLECCKPDSEMENKDDLTLQLERMEETVQDI